MVDSLSTTRSSTRTGNCRPITAATRRLRFAASGSWSIRASSRPCSVSGISTPRSCRGHPAILAAHDHAALDEHADDLLDEERIALGAGQDQVADLLGQSDSISSRLATRAAVGIGQRLQPDLGERSPISRRGRQSPSRAIGLGPQRRDEQDRQLGRERQQLPGDVDRRRVRPVEVLADERPPGPRARAREQPMDRPRRSGPAGPRRSRRSTSASPAAAGPGGARGTARCRRRRVVAEELEQAVARAGARPRRRREREAEDRPDQVDQQVVWQVAAVRDAPALDPRSPSVACRPVTRAAARREPALADARLTDDEGHAAAPGSTTPSVSTGAERLVAPDHRAVEADRRRARASAPAPPCARGPGRRGSARPCP